jgi:hypothetical protein
MQRMTAEMVKLTKNAIIEELHSTVKVTDEYHAEQIMQIPQWVKKEGA